MGWLALLIAGLAVWLIWTGRLQRMTARDGIALGVALIGALLSARGKPVPGVVMLGLSALSFLLRSRAYRPRPDRLPPQDSDDVVAARTLLGVGPDADEQAIRAAHRRLIASVHPDRGGTEALAARINAARDLLLRQDKDRRGPRA